MQLSWTEGEWTNEPKCVVISGAVMTVEAEENSDYWRHTSYDFVHNNGHGLLQDLAPNRSMEITFLLNYSGNFDQAGLLLFADEEHWAKLGVEYSDGHSQLGAVVTTGSSDWSVGRIDEWTGKRVTIRLSRTESAVTVRARVCDEEWRMVRLFPIDPSLHWRCGPMICSPTRGGLAVEFSDWILGDADSSLH